MESIEPVWLFGGIVLLAGALFGVVLNRVFNPAAGDVEKLQVELDQARKDLESYKASVNGHFNKTSDLMNELTQDYVKVYRHLAEGAQTLSDTREFTQVLDQPQGRVLISVEAQADQAPDALAAEADQVVAPVAGDTPGAVSDVSAAAQTVAANHESAVPVDYARVDASDATPEETGAAGSENVEDEKEKSAAVSADKVTPDEDASVAAAEQPAAPVESDTDSAKKT
ncbi:MAG TPA: DUF1043 family protein [Gammaproteobacteria bacterium]|nr:DUF1043 family protein [Gammaproteobacteria bacterium]